MMLGGINEGRVSCQKWPSSWGDCTKWRHSQARHWLVSLSANFASSLTFGWVHWGTFAENHCQKVWLDLLVQSRYHVCLIPVLKLTKISLSSTLLHCKFQMMRDSRTWKAPAPMHGMWTEVNIIMIATAMVSHTLKSGLESCTNPKYPCSQFLGNSRSHWNDGSQYFECHLHVCNCWMNKYFQG